MQGLALTNSGFHFNRQSRKTIGVPHLSGSLYGILQDEVDLGVQSLRRESADMAVTFFQSALQKLTIDEPFYGSVLKEGRQKLG